MNDFSKLCKLCGQYFLNWSELRKLVFDDIGRHVAGFDNQPLDNRDHFNANTVCVHCLRNLGLLK